MKPDRLCLLVLCLSVVITGHDARSYGTNQHPKDDESVDYKRNTRYSEDDGSDVYDDDFGGFNADDDQGKTIDEIIVEATNEAHGFDSTDTVNSSDPKNRLVNIEYDMIFTEEELEELNTDSSEDKRAVTIIDGPRKKRWTNNHIPYQFAPDTFTVSQKSRIKAGMDAWAEHTCLTFAPATSGNRIFFENGDGCTSHVGMIGGAQKLTLAPGCREKSVVLHEVGHAIGLYHEHTRPDRDEYIKIVHENVDSKMQTFFKKLPEKTIKNTGMKYDYISIMHYGAKSFSKNDHITIKTNNFAYQNIIGKRGRLSFRDIKTVNQLQECARANKCKLTDEQCPGEGFVGTDCKCWCPGDPYTLCRMDRIKETSCEDYNSNCAGWAKLKHCSDKRYKAYMAVKCPKACGSCTAVTTCEDETKNCQEWAKSGECQKIPKYMLAKCKKSCNNCKN